MSHLLPLCGLVMVLTVISALDPCYDIQDTTYGNIGNCIPRTSCASGVTVPDMCPTSAGDGFVCCFDENFPGREVRGAWVASVVNIDWPVKPAENVYTQKVSLINLVNSLNWAGFNTIYFQVRPHGDALYSSTIEPWSQYLTGTQGLAPDPFWDPLEFLVDYAHSLNIEVHAWINPYRANMRASIEGLSPQHMAIQYPEYAYFYDTFVWMDPGAEVVQNRTYDVVIDLVTRYDLDGLHMDDYFYPYPVVGGVFPDTNTYNRYLQNGGTMNKEDWRRDNVNVLVERMNVGIHQVKPWVKFSVSPFGIYRAGHPEGMPRPIAGFDQYSEIYCDPKLWLQNGWIDVLQPQLYWQISAPNQSYPQLLDWWVGQNTMNRHIYAGNYLSKVLDGSWPLDEFINQMSISRETRFRLKGSWGNVAFSAKVLRDDVQGAVQFFRENIYKFPALQPAFPWLAEGRALPKAPKIIVAMKTVSWVNAEAFVGKVVIYKQTDNKWQVFKIVSKNRSHVDLAPKGFYAIAALDRFGRESEKIFFQM